MRKKRMADEVRVMEMVDRDPNDERLRAPDPAEREGGS